MTVQPTRLDQLFDAIMSTWTGISKECLKHLVESVPLKIQTERISSSPFCL